MVKLIATTALAVALLASTAAAAAERRDTSYLALREEFETRLGRELSPLEARDVFELAERSAASKLAKKAAKHAHLGSGGSQEEDKRELGVYARELDFEDALLERSWADKWRKWKEEHKNKHQHQHEGSAPAEPPSPRELSEMPPLYRRNFADLLNKFFHPYGDLKKKEEEKKEEKKDAPAAEGAADGGAPAPDASRRSVYDDSMDFMTRSYYGYDDLD